MKLTYVGAVGGKRESDRDLRRRVAERGAESWSPEWTELSGGKRRRHGGGSQLDFGNLVDTDGQRVLDFECATGAVDVGG